MINLTEFIQKDIDNLFSISGAFWAFSREQFDKAKIDGVKYIDDGMGLFIPQNKYDFFDSEYKNIIQNSTKKHIEKYGADAIIRYEYFNHEQQLGHYYDVKDSNTYRALNSFIGQKGFEIENIERVFKECYNEAIENDWF